MESVAGDRTTVALGGLPAGFFVAPLSLRGVSQVASTLKSRTVWFPVLHGRGFL
jgi:hypothetical protein